MPHGYHFRFENYWLKEERFSEIVMECWKKYENLSITERIDYCAQDLKAWGEILSKSFKNRLKRCGERMNHFQGFNDVFSMQNLERPKLNTQKFYVNKKIFGNKGPNCIGFNLETVIPNISIHMLLLEERKTRLVN